MGISMSDSLRTHTFIEMCKTEALNSSLKLFEVMDIPMSDEHKDFVLARVEECIKQYELEKVYELESYILVESEDDTDQVDDFFVKASEVSGLFAEFQVQLVSMLVGIVVVELTTFLLMEGRDKNG